MDSSRFDALARSLTAAGTRRGLLGLLATLPILGGLFTLLDFEETDAKGRRKRRKKRHKHRTGKRKDNRTGKRKGKHKKKPSPSCTPESAAQTCTGRCGSVTNTCQQPVDCGPCACAPPCDVCFVCDEATRSCVPDSDHCGACEEPCPDGQDCQGGVCGFACGSALCDPAIEICVDGSCQSCDVLNGQSLADAIAAAAAGETLHICAGAYGKITVDKSLTLVGAGQESDAASNTILDAAQSGIVVIVNPGATVVLRRLRVTGGKLAGGAGIFNQGTLSLTDCTVTKNDGTNGAAGGIFNRNSGVLNLTNCTVSENKAAVGGGIHQNGSGSVTLDNTVIRLNTSTSAGAGIGVNAGAVNINNGSDIIENTTDGNGGGIINNGTVICDGSGSITGNKGAAGGGIFNGGTVTLNGTPVTGNTPNNCAGDPIAGCVNV